MARRRGEKTRLQIRSYREADREAVVALWEACGLRVPWNDPDEDIALFCRSPDADILVGEIADQLAATLAIGHDGHRGWMYYLAVSPTLRGRGFGAAMIRHAESWLVERGIAKVQLMVREQNFEVKNFYARLGYQLNPCHIMQRWLDDRDAPGIETPRDDGRLEITITYLEMTERPPHPHIVPPHGMKLALLRARRPTIAFYRFLFDTVGEPWMWYQRRALSDEDLSRIITDDQVEIYVLYVDGVPAGYAELDRRELPSIELAYFGLMPDFIGKGLGRYLLTWAIDTAWNFEPERLWVHTCSLDHPRAITLYQRCGFRPYKQEHQLVDDPRVTGLLPVQATLD